jgi:hypothetical protein
MSTPSPHLPQRSDELVQQARLAIEMMIDDGRLDDAKATLRTLMDRSTPEQLAELLGEGGLAELARERNWQLPRRPDVPWRPASQVRTRRGQARLFTRAELDKYLQERRGAGVAAKYWDERGDDPPDLDRRGWSGDEPYLPGQRHAPVVTPADRDEPVWGNPVDPEQAALPDLNGRACLCCRIERTRTDLANPDGLCGEGREKGFTRASVIEGYCAVIVERNPGDRALTLLGQALSRAGRPDDRAVIIEACCAVIADRNPGERATALLRQAWGRHARPDDRAVIAGWVARHEDRLSGTTTGAAPAGTHPGISAAARAGAAVTPLRGGASTPTRGVVPTRPEPATTLPLGRSRSR